MPRDKRISHERIIKAAKKEFLEKGFEKASMRSIGKEAGMTQAALYRHFVSKEAMFSALVEPAINELTNSLKEVEKQAYDSFSEENPLKVLVAQNNVQIIKKLISVYRDEFRLLVCCATGTKYAEFIPDSVRKEQKSTMKSIEFLRNKGYKIKQISENELHILLSAYVTAIFEPVVHNWPLDEAISCLDVIEEFFLPGWKQLLGL